MKNIFYVHVRVRCPNSELKKQQYSPFLNIAQQAINAIKTAIEADVSRPPRAARTDGTTEQRQDERNRFGQFLHSVATSGPAEKYWHYHGCQMWTVVQIYANENSKMFK